MEYEELFKEENESIMERFQLSMERVREIAVEPNVPEAYQDYFVKTAAFIGLIEEFFSFMKAGNHKTTSIEVLKDWNQKFYQDILPEQYEESYANPAYAAAKMGEGYGQLLSYLYKEIRGDIIFVHEWRLKNITILNETFIEIYNLYEEGLPEVSAIKEVIYWFVSDYTDYTVAYRIREGLDPDLSFEKDIICSNDLNDLKYLYYYGEYISDTELKVSEFLNSLPEEKVRLMAKTYTEGYRKGFEVMGLDLSKKSTVQILFELGFERMVKYAIEEFEKMGLRVIFCRAAVLSVNTTNGRRNGYHGTPANRQYDYDHRYDDTIYLDKAFKERLTAVLKVAYENNRELALAYAGPAVIETFGRDGFEPINKLEANSLNARQEKLGLELANEKAGIVNTYVPRDEISFTIIAFPVPDIGEKFEEIFEETIAINTLDYEKYKDIQQIIIDVLDDAEYVEVTGKGDNRTNMRVKLHTLSDREKETNFENCVADVNIPLGEVFTSPVLKNTEGVLNVSTVYIGDYQFKDFVMTFEDGKIKDYSCSNFANEEEGRELVKQVILKNHETLPIGEFAIGTNTTAYAMAQKYGILDKLPILIVEKTGPHFAVGDTCYSRAEDNPMYNPNGKEVIARDNEVSILRKEDTAKAYFNCHTDITIPYKELDRIETVTASGERVRIIDDGKFVLKGTEELNEPLI